MHDNSLGIKADMGVIAHAAHNSVQSLCDSSVVVYKDGPLASYSSWMKSFFPQYWAKYSLTRKIIEKRERTRVAGYRQRHYLGALGTSLLFRKIIAVYCVLKVTVTPNLRALFTKSEGLICGN